MKARSTFLLFALIGIMAAIALESFPPGFDRGFLGIIAGAWLAITSFFSFVVAFIALLYWAAQSRKQ
jgi:hypothetical protein